MDLLGTHVKRMHHVILQHFPAIGHLSCFWSFDIINVPVMNTLVLIYSFIHILG